MLNHEKLCLKVLGTRKIPIMTWIFKGVCNKRTLCGGIFMNPGVVVRPLLFLALNYFPGCSC